MNPLIFLIIALAAGGVAKKARTKKKLLNPVRGKVTSPFGFRIHPISGKRKMHNGVDIPLSVGTPVYSPAAGTAYTSDSKAGGRQLVIVHKGFKSGYAHLSRRVRTGTKVEKGTKIAYSGKTGQVTAPHLHFTWKKGDTYKNPEQYFSF